MDLPHICSQLLTLLLIVQHNSFWNLPGMNFNLTSLHLLLENTTLKPGYCQATLICKKVKVIHNVSALRPHSKLRSTTVQRGALLQLCQRDHGLLWEALHGSNNTDPGNSFSCLAFRGGGRGDSTVNSLVPSGQPTSIPCQPILGKEPPNEGLCCYTKRKKLHPCVAWTIQAKAAAQHSEGCQQWWNPTNEAQEPVERPSKYRRRKQC